MFAVGKAIVSIDVMSLSDSLPYLRMIKPTFTYILLSEEYRVKGHGGTLQPGVVMTLHSGRGSIMIFRSGAKIMLIEQTRQSSCWPRL